MANRTWLGLCLVVLLSTASAGGTGGNDEGPDPEMTPFAAHDATSPSVSGSVWSLKLVLDDEVVANGSTVAITTQICTNDGVCDPPVAQESTVSDDGSTYTISLTPKDDHTYVNWRVRVTWADGSTEDFPDADWYKVWSSCWFDGTSWGGPEADATGCTEADEDAPGLGLLLTVGALTGAALTVHLVSRRT
jgi:hypothetical protein